MCIRDSRMSGLEEIPEDAAGFMIIGSKYDLSPQEAEVFRKFLADMPGNGFNVCLQHFHILEDSVVDTLQYIAVNNKQANNHNLLFIILCI